MTPAKINAVLAEIERFKEAAKATLLTQTPNNHEIYPSRETGRLRRASMDLSMALVNLRKGDR
jgi:hypothetical protein